MARGSLRALQDVTDDFKRGGIVGNSRSLIVPPAASAMCLVFAFVFTFALILIFPLDVRHR
jgi:hypothetical protein